MQAACFAPAPIKSQLDVGSDVAPAGGESWPSLDRQGPGALLTGTSLTGRPFLPLRPMAANHNGVCTVKTILSTF
jgi:hypothetical protein